MENKIVFPKDVLENRHRMNPDVFEAITKRDSKCIYCKEGFILWQTQKPHRGKAPSVEHIINKNIPWRKLKTEESGICCGSCNSSRGPKYLKLWFTKTYCKERDINENSVEKIVRHFIASQKSKGLRW